MKIIVIMVTLAAITLLAGCAFDVSKFTGNYSPQDYGGCTVVKYRQPDGTLIDWTDCKDKASVNASLNASEGRAFTYDASDVSGLEQMKLRAEVHKALSDNNVKATDNIINSIIRSLGGR